MKVRLALTALGLALSLTSLAAAHTEIYTTSLSGPNESPSNNSLGIGTATVTLDLDLATMRVQTQFSGLTGTVTNAHIHGPTIAPATTAGVMTTTPTFPGFPAGATFGSYDQTFDLTLASSYNPAFVTANGGTVGGAYAALTSALQSGTSYLNIHSSVFGGGEIRGFLTVPEPASIGAVAAAGLLALRRRRA